MLGLTPGGHRARASAASMRRYEKKECAVFRRYSDFQWLRKRLLCSNPGMALPWPLPFLPPASPGACARARRWAGLI